MDIFLLYLFTRLNAISNLFEGLGFFFIFVAAVATFAYIPARDPDMYSEATFAEDRALAKKVSSKILQLGKVLAAASLLCFSLMALTPTKEDVAFIVGGKIGIEVVQSTEVKETSLKLYELLHKKLDNMLEEPNGQ